jgi:DNA-binding LacI/PurR family transcriptional regulator
MPGKARPKRLASMSDVAARARVSTMTVSNVINRPHTVSEPTRLKVQRAMRELNYRNNLVARSLRLTQPRQICYSISPRQSPSSLYMGQFLHDLAQACQAQGRNLTLLAEKSSETLLDAYEDLYFGKSVAGFVIASVQPDDQRPLELDRRGIPFVAYGQTSAGERVPWSWVEGDAASGVEMASDHVVAVGHTELAFVGYQGRSMFTRNRLAGYLNACARHGLTRSADPHRVIATLDDIPAGRVAATQLLTSEAPPTAIVCGSDAIAAGCLIAARELSLTPGRDIAVTGFDDSPLTSFGTIGITSVRQHSEEIANTLIEYLIEPPDQPRHVLVKPELIIRSSTSR